MPRGLADLETKWDALGREDPLWAILTDPSKAGGRWSPEEFFATGRTEIDNVFAELAALELPVQPGTALDFGCGVGRLTQALAERFGHVIGLDVAPSMVELARAHERSGGNVTYRVNRTPHGQVPSRGVTARHPRAPCSARHE
jgi:SAM-dependent methyltransferase